MTPNNRFLSIAASALFGALAPHAATAGDIEGHKTVAGLSVYLGILPAAVVQDHRKDHAEATMHGGVPRGYHVHHVMAAVFNAKTGERIENAKVEARVAPVGLAGQTRTLEPMEIAGTITYGNYFTMRDNNAYRIRLSITPAGAARPVVLEFSHKHRTR